MSDDHPRIGPGVMLGGLAWDVGLPLAAYYGLHALGAADWPALLAATAVAGLRIVWVAVRDRRLNAFATMMLVVFGIGLILSFVSGDARFLLLKDSITTAVVGLTFLVTSLRGTPLTLAAAQGFRPADRERIAEQYRAEPVVRGAYQGELAGVGDRAADRSRGRRGDRITGPVARGGRRSSRRRAGDGRRPPRPCRRTCPSAPARP